MMVDPSDAGSLALALRQRMTLREPIVRLAGAIPREEELAKMAAGDHRFEVDAVDSVSHGFGLRGLDPQTRGTTRDGDHERFAGNATGHAFFLRGEFVAYAYVWPDGRIGPLACASQAYLVQIFAYALLSLTRTYGASWCSALVPGSNHKSPARRYAPICGSKRFRYLREMHFKAISQRTSATVHCCFSPHLPGESLHLLRKPSAKLSDAFRAFFAFRG